MREDMSATGKRAVLTRRRRRAERRDSWRPRVRSGTIPRPGKLHRLGGIRAAVGFAKLNEDFNFVRLAVFHMGTELYCANRTDWARSCNPRKITVSPARQSRARCSSSSPAQRPRPPSAKIWRAHASRRCCRFPCKPRTRSRSSGSRRRR